VIVLKKHVQSSLTPTPFKIWLQRQRKVLKRAGAGFWKNARPFLTPKYWIVYFIAFGIGFYLWGPMHGWQNLRFRPTHQAEKDPAQATETLQQQLKQLKMELQSVQQPSKALLFDTTTFGRPALGQIIRGFDWVQSGNSWRLHNGVDIGVPPGSSIIAAAAGTIAEVKTDEVGDYTVTVNHGGGWQSSYGNLAKVMVAEGQPIIKGVILGISSAKGCDPVTPCFHFAIYHDQQAVDPEKIISGMQAE
jgi:murein DD-endopeptidase MepM/ murein hydrolase activator NlpD